MNEVKKVLFIVNKFAGGTYQPQVEGRILKSCELFDIEGRIEFTQGPGHATLLAKDAATYGVEYVVAVGGDGTLNEVAQGLVNTSFPMGIIARGSGNGLARHLCIPLDIPQAVETIATGRVLNMDTFRLNGELSLNVSGVGFDGHIANLFGGATKRGLAGYAKLVLKEFIQSKEFEASLVINGQTLSRKAFVIAIANSSQYGNNACIAPNASVADGLLHINILKKIPPYRFDFVYDFFSKALHRSSFCEIHEASSLTIKTTQPVSYHVDGEPSGTASEFVIEVMPSALQMIVPAKTGKKTPL